MSDKDRRSENKLSDNEAVTSKKTAPTDNGNQQGLSASINLTSVPVNEQTKSPETKSTATHTESKQPIKKDSNMNKAPIERKSATSPKKERTSAVQQQQNKVSKIAVLALLIALLAIAASAGHYYWSEKQKSSSIKQLTQQLTQQLNNKLQKQTTLFQQQLQNNKQLIATSNSVERETEKRITLLQQQISNLSKNQPSDWLLHEAEYLIRVASRSLWLEKDTSAAIGLLHDADRRMEELDDPQFLPVRQVIQQDIAELQLLPTLNTDNVILKLMALAQQTKQLPIAMVDIPNSDEQENDLELTENVSDWQENLAITWHKFLADFITVSRRTGDVEPLMSPEFTQNLRENLNLKIQTTIFAVTKGNTKIYQQSLTDIQMWLNDYFDMTEIANQNFSQALLALEDKSIKVNYPNKLSSLTAIRKVIANNAAPAPAQPVIIAPKALPKVIPAAEPQKAETTSAQPEDS